MEPVINSVSNKYHNWQFNQEWAQKEHSTSGSLRGNLTLKICNFFFLAKI